MTIVTPGHNQHANDAGPLSVGTLAAPAVVTARFRVVGFTDTTVADPPTFPGSPQCDPADDRFVWETWPCR